MSSSHREKRRRQILNAAINVFGSDGFHNGTVEDIATSAGIGKGTVYEYFSSKQEIFEQMILTILSDYLNSAKIVVSKDIPLKEKLVLLLEFDKRLMSKDILSIEQSITGLQNASSEFTHSLKDLHKSIFDFVIELISDAKNKGEIDGSLDENLIALIWINIMNGLNRSAKMFRLSDSLDVEQVVDILYKGIE